MQVYGEEASEEAVMSTYAIVKFNLEDTTAIQKAAFTVTDNRTFGGTAPFRIFFKYCLKIWHIFINQIFHWNDNPLFCIPEQIIIAHARIK